MHIFRTFRIFQKLLDKGRSKKAGIYPKISTQLSSKCHKWGREREGGFYFFCRCILLAELRGVREDGYPQATKQKWAKCNCSRPFLEMLCRGRMPRHHIENPLSIIKAMIAIGRASERWEWRCDRHPFPFVADFFHCARRRRILPGASSSSLEVGSPPRRLSERARRVTNDVQQQPTKVRSTKMGVVLRSRVCGVPFLGFSTPFSTLRAPRITLLSSSLFVFFARSFYDVS